MNTQDIRDLVAAKIAGQGTNVDAGSALPTIINALCDIIDNLPTPQELPIVEITEDLPVEVSQERYNELRNTGVLKYGNALYVLTNPGELLSVPQSPHGRTVECSFYSVMMALDDTLALSGYSGVVLWSEEVEEQGETVERFHIDSMDV